MTCFLSTFLSLPPGVQSWSFSTAPLFCPLVPGIYHPTHLQLLATRPPEEKCVCGVSSVQRELGDGITEVLEGRLGRAGQKAQPPSPFSKDTASLVVRPQGGLSADVLRGKMHLKIARDHGVGKPRQGDGWDDLWELILVQPTHEVIISRTSSPCPFTPPAILLHHSSLEGGITNDNTDSHCGLQMCWELW